MLDAYTVRKAVPRILIAAIGINLSIYLCLAAVDITNIIAEGMAGLLVAPFDTSGMASFGVKTGAPTYLAGGVGVALGSGPMTAATVATYTAIATQGIGAITGALASMLFLLIPAVFLALAVLVTVVIRQALLFFLIVSAPVAIACFILPGTEKYFQKWWDLFLKTLLVYPIIAVIFAVSDVFASIIFSTAEGNVVGIAKIVTGIIVIFAPLFMIPFAFRFAGGAIAAIAGAATGAGDRMAKSGFVKARREYYGQRTADNLTRGRAEAYRNAVQKADTRQGITRGRAAGWRARKYSGYQNNILDRESELNARQGEMLQKATGHGDDALQRAYTVNKELADRQMAAGIGAGDTWKKNEDGSTSYRTAGGSWASSFSVDESRRKYGKNNVTQLQQSLSYEMRKATTQEEQDKIVTSFGAIADEWKLSENQANGTWIGAGFANQDTNLQWKHGRWNKDNGSFAMAANAAGVIQEIDEKKGSWEAGRYNADTWTSMTREVENARKVVGNADAKMEDRVKAQETIYRAARVAESISQSVPKRDPASGQILLDAKGNPIMEESVGAGAAGRVAEEMRAFSTVAREAGAGAGYAPNDYGTPTDRKDTPRGQVTPRTDDEFQSNDDRERPTSN